MGDNGEIYVPKELLPIYKESILPIASILLPNHFEAQLLTGIKIENESDVWNAINVLHDKGIETVCISSAEFPTSLNTLCIFGSSRKGKALKLRIDIPKLPASFTGSGDLFSALMLCFMHQTKSDLKESLEKAVAALQAVLKRTLDYASGKELTPRNMELRLIQSRDDILQPNVLYKAVVVE